MALSLLPMTIALAGAAGVVSGGDASCGACHLHADLIDDARRRTPKTPAGRHAVRGVRCIDCHRGRGAVDVLVTGAVAARDTFVWLIGRAREPEALRVPALAERACVRCHGSGRTGRGFHARSQHALDVPVGCLACHAGHEAWAAGRAPLERIERGCARCHTAVSEVVNRHFEGQREEARR